MSNIPTAEEFLYNQGVPLKELQNLSWFDYGNILTWLEVYSNIKTRFHVEAALKAAAEKATAEIELGNPYDPESGYPIVNKESILNAYPLNLIK
jgi:hypothetical protein